MMTLEEMQATPRLQIMLSSEGEPKLTIWWEAEGAENLEIRPTNFGIDGGFLLTRSITDLGAGKAGISDKFIPLGKIRMLTVEKVV